MKFLIVSIIFALGSFILAYNKIDGWGWFLFGSIITFNHVDPPSNNKKYDEYEDYT